MLTTHHASTHLNHVHVWLNAHSYSANAHIDATDTVNQIAFRAMPNHHTHTLTLADLQYTESCISLTPSASCQSLPLSARPEGLD